MQALLLKVAFVAAIDIPLSLGILIMGLWYCQHWAKYADLDSPIDLQSRLGMARARVAVVVGILLLFAWSTGLAVWSILLWIGLVGILACLIFGDIGFLFAPAVAVGWILREWAFGFPELKLQPKPQPDLSAEHHPAEIYDVNWMDRQGQTVSPLRPSGHVQIDGQEITVVSADGTFINSGVEVVVTGIRNGRPCVQLIEDHAD